MKIPFDLSAVYTKTYEAPPIDKGEILRYSGACGNVPEIDALTRECLAELDGVLTYKACFRIFDVSADGTMLDLGFTRTDSAALSKNLHGCDRIVVFAATVGIGLDRLIARYSRISPSKALVFQAIGAERIEALCDAFCAEVNELAREKGCSVRPRFSPGYGDLELSLQRDIFSVLDCSRKIGLTLNESLLMSPTKSVTAIIGIMPDD
ncbi:MAG: Vitamin B12 dependent methionine synthase activation subunit [Clostridia bacterium]|nr:Vitamin B12 dependent methionine synthase activation subunit [Clostridia bacterium]